MFHHKVAAINNICCKRSLSPESGWRYEYFIIKKSYEFNDNVLKYYAPAPEFTKKYLKK